MANILVGNDVINRATSTSAGFTIIDINNPCNGTGLITEIQIWSLSTLSNCKVGFFKEISANVFRCVESYLIGSVSSGGVRSFSVTMNVESGWYIGIYYSSGAIERDNSGVGYYTYTGDALNLNEEQTYTFGSPRIISLKGIGYTLNPASPRADLVIDLSGKIENNYGIVRMRIDDEILYSPVLFSREANSNVNIITPQLFEGHIFIYWKVIQNGIDIALFTENEIDVSVISDLEIRAIYKKLMFRNSVRVEESGYSKNESNFRADVQIEIL